MSGKSDQGNVEPLDPPEEGKRDYLKAVAGLVAGLAVGGAAGWLGKPAERVTERITETIRETATVTATPTPEKPEFRVVWAWGCSWFTGYIPSMVGAHTAAKIFNMELSWEGSKAHPGVGTEYADFVYAKLAGLDPERDMIVVHYIGQLSDMCKEALDRGVGVFTSNEDDWDVPIYQRERLSYVGQVEYEAGRFNAEYLLKRGLLKEGDRVCISMGERGVPSLEYRFNGTRDVCEGIGCTIDELIYTYETAEVASRLEAYYRGHPDVKAIFCCDGAGGLGMETFQKSAGLEPGELPNIVWDPTDIVIEGIKHGYITGANDQQFYLQGFYPIAIAWLWKNEFTNFISPVSVNVGATMVDETNADTFDIFVKDCTEYVRDLGWWQPEW